MSVVPTRGPRTADSARARNDLPPIRWRRKRRRYAPSSLCPHASPRRRFSSLAAERQSLADRHGGDAGHVSGSARHLGGQRGPAAHRRQPLGQHRRGHLGADQLPGLQRHRAADDRLAEQFFRPQAVPDRCIVCSRWPRRPAGRPTAGLSDSRPRRFKGPPAGPCSRFRRRFSWKVSRRPNAAWLWPSSAWAWWWRRSSVRCWAAGSPTIIPGAGCSTSTSPSASWRC